MRVIIKAPPNPLLWFHPANSVSYLTTNGLFALADNVIPVVERFDLEGIRSSLKQTDDHELQAHLLDLLEVLPIAEIHAMVEPDFVIDSDLTPPQDLGPGSPPKGLRELIVSVRSGAKHQESREIVFKRSFQRLAPLARDIQIMDAYAYKSILEQKGGEWLLLQIMKNTSANISIHTTLKPKFELDITERFFQARLEKFVSETKYRGTLSVTVYPKVPHGRSMNFEFSHGNQTFHLDKGLDTFQHPTFGDSTGFFEDKYVTPFATRKKLQESRPVLQRFRVSGKSKS